MKNIYIDESGSMTSKHTDSQPYFIIALMMPKTPNRLKRAYKRFISKNYDALKTMDTDCKMFDGDVFKELKGSALTPEMKIKFIDYFCRNNLFEIYYVRVNNKRIYGLYDNTARAFNYIMKLALGSFFDSGHLEHDDYTLHIDERNEKCKTIYFLEEYLNVELSLHQNVLKGVTVQYYDSSDLKFIQIADVFANILYSACFHDTYNEKLLWMKDNGYMKECFNYPK